MNEELEKELAEVKASQEKINNLYRKLGYSSDLFLIPCPDFEYQLKVNDIQLITSRKGSVGLEFFDSQGKSYKSKPSLTLGMVEKSLSAFPQFIRTHESYFVNFNHLDYFSPSETDSQGRTVVLKNTDLKAPLSSANADKVKEYFKIKSLEHVEPWNREYQAIIDENLRGFSKEIRFMSAAELKENFRFKATGEFHIREFMANMIWEYYNLLQLGKRDPIEGNIRTFWYYLKPTLGKAVTINSAVQYGIMIDVFRELVVTHGLFKYKDFGFISDDTGNYIFGNKRPDIILAGEKAGHFKKLQRLQEEFGVTIISLGGMPSILNTEYFIDELEKLVNIKESPVHLITLVDYNPSSAIIARTFVHQMEHEGVKNLSTIGHLLTPASFSPEELPHVTDQIPMITPADKTKVRKWLEAGGGIDFGDGVKQPLGIECEALILDFERLKTLFKKELDKILNPLVKNDSESYKPELIDLSGLAIDLFPVESLKINT